jgi:molybdenum cofactor cytidylyltransferase
LVKKKNKSRPKKDFTPGGRIAHNGQRIPHRRLAGGWPKKIKNGPEGETGALRIMVRFSKTATLPIPGILLMAGRSSRLGFPKALLPFDQGTLIERTLGRVLSSRLSPVILVLGDQRWRIQRVLAPFRSQTKLKILFNPDFAQGMSTSIRKGLEAVEPGVPGVMFILGDQPLIRTSAIDRLVRVFIQTQAPAVVPLYDGKPGNPVTFRRDLLPALKRQRGDVGGRGLIQKYRTAIQFLPIRPAYQGWDVDTWEDYARIKDRIDGFPKTNSRSKGFAAGRQRGVRP